MLPTRRVVPWLAFPTALFLSLACGAYGSETLIRLESNDRAVRNGTTRHLLRADELKKASGSNALEVVQQLRPNFLRTPGAMHAPTVFVDHLRLGGVSELRLIPAASVQEIRYLDARAATHQFGLGYSGGVIYVRTITGPR